MGMALLGPSGRVILGNSIIRIGRSLLSTMPLDDSRVSAHHAEIRSDGQGYVIIYLDSRNDVFVNERGTFFQPGY